MQVELAGAAGINNGPQTEPLVRAEGEKKHGTQNKVEQRNITYRSRIYQRHLQSNRDLENSFTMLISVGP